MTIVDLTDEDTNLIMGSLDGLLKQHGIKVVEQAANLIAKIKVVQPSKEETE